MSKRSPGRQQGLCWPRPSLAAARWWGGRADETHFETAPVRDVLTQTSLRTRYGVPLRHLAFEHEGRQAEALVPVFGRLLVDCVFVRRSGRAA